VRAGPTMDRFVKRPDNVRETKNISTRPIFQGRPIFSARDRYCRCTYNGRFKTDPNERESSVSGKIIPAENGALYVRTVVQHNAVVLGY